MSQFKTIKMSEIGEKDEKEEAIFGYNIRGS